MTRKLTTFFAATAILTSLGTPTAVLAEETTPSPMQGTSMMGGHGMMRQLNPDHMKQMTRMVENCNRMMESMTTTPEKPGKAPAPGSHG